MQASDTAGPELATLDGDGLRAFDALRHEAAAAVIARFAETYSAVCARLGPAWLDSLRDDMAYHIEFLRPVLEFGSVAPMVDCLRWLASVLAARSLPSDHLGLSLDWLHDFYAARFPPASFHVVSAALRAVQESFANSTDLPVVRQPPPPDSAAGDLELAMLSGNYPAASAIVAAQLGAGRSLVDIELHTIQPALYSIGEKWRANQVSVAQEHVASAIAQALMTNALLQSRPPLPNGKRALLACVEGNHHCIGVRMVTDALYLAGWDAQYLGANVPTTALVEQIVEWKPDLVALSVSFPQQLKGVKAAIALLRARLGDARPPILVGGLAINQFDRLAQAVGADGTCADARQAVAFAGKLTTPDRARTP